MQYNRLVNTVQGIFWNSRDQTFTRYVVDASSLSCSKVDNLNRITAPYVYIMKNAVCHLMNSVEAKLY